MATVVRLDLDADPELPGAVTVRVGVEIDGEARSLILDTGGSRSGLAGDGFTDGLAPAPAPVTAARGVFAEGGPVRRVVAREMRIGGLVVPDPVFDVEHPRAPSILGLDVLRWHRLDVRFSAATLVLDGDASVDDRRPLVRSSQGHPLVDVEWGPARATAIWDSGASVSVVDRVFAAGHPDLFATEGSSSGIDSRGHESEVAMVRMAAVEIGGRRFEPSIAVVVDIAGIEQPGDPPFELILGMPVLGQADWVLDLAEGWWGYPA